MFTFNDYQYFSYIEEIYSYLINSPEESKNAIKMYYGDAVKTKPKAMPFINGVKTGAVIGETVTLLAALVTNNPEIIARFMPTYLYIFTGSMLAEAFLRTKKSDDKPASDMYYKYVEDTSSDFEYGSSFIPSDDQIHQMTASLMNGEFEDKYSRMDLFGKCPVTITSETSPDGIKFWNLPVKDGGLSRIYEVAMHFAAEPFEGYEDVLRALYILIKNYVHAYTTGNKEEQEKLYEEFEEIRRSVVEKRGR